MRFRSLQTIFLLCALVLFPILQNHAGTMVCDLQRIECTLTASRSSCCPSSGDNGQDNCCCREVSPDVGDLLAVEALQPRVHIDHPKPTACSLAAPSPRPGAAEIVGRQLSPRPDPPGQRATLAMFQILLI